MLKTLNIRNLDEETYSFMRVEATRRGVTIAQFLLILKEFWEQKAPDKM